MKKFVPLLILVIGAMPVVSHAAGNPYGAAFVGITKTAYDGAHNPDDICKNDYKAEHGDEVMAASIGEALFLQKHLEGQTIRLVPKNVDLRFHDSRWYTTSKSRYAYQKLVSYQGGVEMIFTYSRGSYNNYTITKYSPSCTEWTLINNNTVRNGNETRNSYPRSYILKEKGVISQDDCANERKYMCITRGNW